MAEEKGRRRHFSPEFKMEAIRRAGERQADGVPLTQIAREMGVTDHLLRSWRRQAEARNGAPAADVFPGQGRLPRAQQEIAFLKSAAAYFARESR